MLSRFKSYLSNMSQYVQIVGQKSSNSNIACGVPQRSIFRPLLFILYINDFNSYMKDLKFIHFADAGTLYAKDKSLSNLAGYIKTGLHKLVKFFKLIGYPLMFKNNFSQRFPWFPKPICLLFLLIELISFFLPLQTFLEY